VLSGGERGDAAQVVHGWASLSPRLLERALESLGAGLVIIDATRPGFPISYANFAFEELTGYTREEITDRAIDFVAGPDTDPAEIERLTAALRDGRHERATFIAHRKDGAPFWNEVSLSPVFDEADQPVCFVCFQHDVSEREVAVTALRDAEERYRRLSENLPGIVTYVAEYDGRPLLTYVSPQIEELLGYTRDAWLRHDTVWFEAIHPEDRERVMERERRRFELGEPFEIEYRLVAADGRVVWVWDKDTVASSPDGEDRRHEGLLVDITASKESEAALLRGQELHRSVVQALEEGVVVIRADGEVLSANPSAERILGLDPLEDGAMEAWDASERYGEDGSRSKPDVGAVRQVLATGEPVRDLLLQFRHKPSGELRWLSVNYQQVAWTPEGRTQEIVVSFRDITARRKTAIDLRRSEERLRSVISSAPLGLWALDRDGRFTLTEGRALEKLGVGPEELIGESVFDVYARYPHVIRDNHAALAGKEVSSTVDLNGVVIEYHLSPLVEDGAITGLLGVAIDVTERTRAEERLSHMAMHDSLTGLPNRSLFLDRLDHALARGRREGRRCCVLFIDLDRFKRINDSLGHRAGDQILLESADRIAHALRADDSVARLGGDEFTVLCESISGEEEALLIADKVAEELGHLYELDDGELYVTASIGVAVSDRESSPEQMLRDADAAMYRAKSQGRARTELFDEVSRSDTVNRLALESSLHNALDRSELRLLYQPKVSLKTGRVAGYEALLRWHHPARGLLAPEEFIHVAEDSGLIVPIGRWALTEAARQCAEWSAGRDEPLLMCVNLSARQFAQPDIVDDVAEAIRSTGVKPACLCLEITETVVMEQTHTTIATLAELKKLGVRLAIDDFGTGYSSLGYLQRFRLDFLKVDRSFVDGLASDPEQRAIVDAIVKMAQALGLDVIAEGVEQPEQVVALRELGCDLMQGFLFAEPEPPEQAAAMLDQDVAAALH
jgi:diguanylate cyclase (GGDEF)-like protein/PAS domain S-box-containing protein